VKKATTPAAKTTTKKKAATPVGSSLANDLAALRRRRF
jgi:hypothetical protein